MYAGSFEKIEASFNIRTSAAPIAATTAGIFLSADPAGNDVGCTAHSRCDLDSIGRAIQGTGAAFHAGIPIHQAGSLALHGKYLVGAYHRATTAPDTTVAGVIKGGDSGKIPECFHVWLS
jgi:hypothetical protein